MKYALMETPLGSLTLVGDEDGLEAIHFGRRIPEGAADEGGAHARALEQLAAYFAGKRRDFQLPLRLRGTPFQMRVWEALLEIPFGRTASYGDIARRIGRPGASRAVGMANHQNPIPIIIPCHRVIGRDGSLTGYGGGLDIKERLLTLEGALPRPASAKEYTATSSRARGRSTAAAPALFT